VREYRAACGAVAATASAATAAAFSDPDEPPQGAINANAGSFRDPGPQNPEFTSQFRSAINPPATNVGAQFWRPSTTPISTFRMAVGRVR
jgi:oxalate decarboxylase